MSRKAIIITVLLLLVVGCQSKIGIEFSKEPGLRGYCREWLDSLCAETLMGRKTGSLYDEKAFNYICRMLHNMDYSYDIQVFASNGGKSTLRNIVVEVPGAREEKIIIGAHYDGPLLSNTSVHYPAANDNASGVVTLMALLDTLKTGNLLPKCSLVCSFWDGEEVFDGSWAQGSRHFVKAIEHKEGILFYLNLDSVGHNHVLYIKHKGHGYIDDVVNTLIANGRLSYVPIDMNNDNGGSSDYVPFGQAGIPYISFGDHNGDMCSFKSHSINDLIEAISLDRIVVHVENILDFIQ